MNREERDILFEAFKGINSIDGLLNEIHEYHGGLREIVSDKVGKIIKEKGIIFEPEILEKIKEEAYSKYQKYFIRKMEELEEDKQELQFYLLL